MQCSELARWLGLLFAQYVSFYLFLEKKMWINGSNTFSTFFSVHQQLRHLGTAICFNVTFFCSVRVFVSVSGTEKCGFKMVAIPFYFQHFS